MPTGELSLQGWWNASVTGRSKEEGRRVAALLIYTAWNLWKERNRRAFQGVAATPVTVLLLIKEEMQLREFAVGGTSVY
jgi:hypothetical protein